jgi:putative nucleotidyltransferase with HDIG domain
MTDVAPAAPAPQGALAEQLEKIVMKKIASDQLVLPAMPVTALKCLTMLKNPDFSLKDAATLVERDPVLTAQVMKLASNAALATREPVQSVLNAVTRFGIQKLKSFLIESSARKVFESRDARIAEASRGLWEHSLAVAIMARDVVAFANCGQPEFGYLGGLLHDVGKPIVAAMLLEAEKAILAAKPNMAWISSDEWIAIIQRIHRQVAVALAKKWEMPEAVCRSIQDCEEYDNADRLSIANAVRFANAVAKQQGLYIGAVNLEDIGALVMIGQSLLGMEGEVLSRLSDGLKTKVKEQMS